MTGTTGKRTRLPAAERRRLILEAVRPVFVANGLHGTRTRDLAAAAGVNEALIYQHFTSKEELFDEAIMRPLEDIARRLAASTALPSFDNRGRPQREATRLFVANMLAALVDSVSLFGLVLFADRDAGRRFYQERIAPMLDQMIEVVRANLSVWPHREFDPSVAITAGFGMCWGLALDAAYRGVELDVESVSTALTDLLFEGVQGMTASPRRVRRKRT